MSISLIVRSALALLLCVGVAALTIRHAGVPPISAIETAIGDQGGTGAVLPTPVPYVKQRPVKPSPTASGRPGGTPSPTPTPRRVVIPSGLASSSFYDVPGYIFFTDTHHNLQFITGQHAHKAFTGDNASVAPAFSPGSHRLAWVLFKRNYSDIEITALDFRRDGAVIPISTTTLTQDETPPPALQSVPAPLGFQPSYEWWATKPAWLPDGRHLLYLSDRPGFDPSNPADTEMSVWEQGITDTITDAVKLSTPVIGTGGHDSPAWRPGDPSTFLYANYGFSNTSPPLSQGVIEVAGALTATAVITAPSDLTPQGVTAYHPVWSPDGRYIAFAQDNATHTGTRLMLIPFHPPGYLNDYNHSIVVAEGAPYVVQPFWSPDGTYLGYLTGGAIGFQLVIRRVYEGSTVTLGPPIAIVQAGTISADYRPTWGM